jgi:Fe-S-cluster containining protein
MIPLPQAVSAREAACLSCREKTCCSYYVVSVTGSDVWRIMRALQLSPADFLRYWETAEEAPGRFLLRPEGPYCELVLAKRPMPEPLASPCVFLTRTSDGHGVCGLGDLRPGQCQAYPVYLEDGRVRLINDPRGCVRTWSYGDVDLARERDRFRRLAAEQEEHQATVAEWNRRVREARRERAFEEFCAYLANRHAEEVPS